MGGQRRELPQETQIKAALSLFRARPTRRFSARRASWIRPSMTLLRRSIVAVSAE